MVAHGALVMFIRPPQGAAGISVLTWESIILKGNEKNPEKQHGKKLEKNGKKKKKQHEEREEGSGAGKSVSIIHTK